MNITFNITEIISDFSISPEQIQQLNNEIIFNLAESIFYNWREEVHQSLHSTRNQYLRGLIQPEYFQDRAEIVLMGVLPNMIEDGTPPFDMKDGFVNSKKIKFGKNGKWYLTIPYRWSAPGSLAENEAFSNTLPREVHKLLLEKQPQITVQGKTVQYGHGLAESELPENMQGIRLTRKAINRSGKVYGAYTHKSNIHSGIVREQKTYENATQNQYVSFRRVSENSDPLAWIHPGFTQRNFAKKAVDNSNIDILINNTVDNFLTNLGL